MKKIYTTLLALTICSIAICQEYTDYVGAGHNIGVAVTSSSDTPDSPASNTFDGSGMDSRLFETGRFLSQATLGADLDLINTVKDMDYEVWLDQQMTEPATYLEPMIESVWQEVLDTVAAWGFEDPEDVFGPAMTEISYAWWHNSMTASDLVRQKVAFALSQILVISTNSDLGGEAVAVGNYYDIFIEHGLGNYRDILSEVARHPNMGYYLSHLNNPKAIPEENVHPDENFAREIMQLFSIGLYELNLDGTHVLDNDGNSIPTYDNGHIKELAEVFTGFGPGDIDPERVTWTDEPYFGLGYWGAAKDIPMDMYPEWHDQSDKIILKNDTLVFPQGLEGQALYDACMEDFENTIDILFNHPNVGPFIGYRLIQRLVKSNPTPEYVARVATVFNDNGSGVRGDMAAVVKAILLDDEARLGEYMWEQHSSRLKETLVRHAQFTKGIATVPDDQGRYWQSYDYGDRLKQQVLNSPTVFNFYLPNHQPVGEIASNNFVAPEFKIHDTATAINYFNAAYSWTQDWGGILRNSEGYWDPDYVHPNGDTGYWYDYGFDDIVVDFEVYRHLATTPDLLINELDKVLTYGQLSDEVRNSIRENLPNIQWTGYDWEKERIRTAIYLIIVSPDFAVIR